MKGRTNSNSGNTSFPTSIYVATAPTTTTYDAGSTLDTSGIKIKAKYSDETEKDITSECSYTPISGTILYETDTYFTITWVWENQITYTVQQPITVNRILKSIAITSSATKTDYVKGDTLDLTGLVITATYDKTTENVTNYTTSPASGSTLSTLGEVTVTISYTERGITKTASYTIKVSVKTVNWKDGSDADIVNMVAAADAGVIDLSEWWAVGQTRTVTLPAMSATNVGESHAAQTVTLVLLNAGGKTLTNGKECSFVVGLLDCLNETGYMNSSNTNDGSWEGSKRRAWCNNEFKTAMLSTGIGSIFKQHYNITAKTYNGTSSDNWQQSTDWFALPAGKEVFGSEYSSGTSYGGGYSNYIESTKLSQFSYYADNSHRIKKANSSAVYWWERSPYYDRSNLFCCVYSDGSASANYASSGCGLAPFGCI